MPIVRYEKNEKYKQQLQKIYNKTSNDSVGLDIMYNQL